MKSCNFSFFLLQSFSVNLLGSAVPPLHGNYWQDMGHFCSLQYFSFPIINYQDGVSTPEAIAPLNLPMSAGNKNLNHQQLHLVKVRNSWCMVDFKIHRTLWGCLKEAFEAKGSRFSLHCSGVLLQVSVETPLSLSPFLLQSLMSEFECWCRMSPSLFDCDDLTLKCFSLML